MAGNAQTPNWDWAKSSIGNHLDYGYSVATDAGGNIYMCGRFYSDTITFGNINLVNAGHLDIFLVKYDPNGNVLWAKRYGGIGYEMARSLAIDRSGNIIICGYFFGTQSFKMDSITLNLSLGGSSSNMDILVAKFDPNGNVLWAFSAGGIFRDEANCITTVGESDILVAGLFESSIISLGNCTLANPLNEEFMPFIVRLDANGNCIWARRVLSDFVNVINSVSSSGDGNAFLAGYSNSRTLTFDSIILNVPATDIDDNGFVAKYNSSGKIVLVKYFGGNSEDRVFAVHVDGYGDMYATGSFKSATLNLDNYTLQNIDPSQTRKDIFLAKYNSSGNIIWAKSVGGLGDDIAYSVTTDFLGNVIMYGSFGSDSIKFGNVTLHNSSKPSGYDLAIIKYDRFGTLLWAKSAYGTGSEYATSATANAIGEIFLTGYFSKDLTFGSTTFVNTQPYDVFIAKIADTVYSGLNEKQVSNELIIYPNPATNTITFETGANNLQLQVYNLNGQMIMDKKLKAGSNTIDITGFPQGMYFCRLTDTDKFLQSGKFIKK